MKKSCNCLERILAGDDSQEIRAHLAQCQECAATKSAWDALKKTSVRPDVPEFLSANIRNYAAAASHGKLRRFRIKYIWMPAAAALFACFCLAYSVGLETHRRPAPQAQLPIATYSDMDALDSDLIALTAQLEQTSNSLLGEALLSSIMDAQKQGGNI